MVWRSLVMRTRSSRASSPGPDGARTTTFGVSGGCEGAPLAMTSRTSPFSTWPRLPEPCTWSTAMLLSASSLAAAGAGGILRSSTGPSPATLAVLTSACLTVDAPADPAACAIASGLVAGLEPSPFLAGFAPAPASILPSNAPTPTVSPSFAVMSARTPAAGDGTSTVTLSVSSSTSGSSTATVSPAFLNHLPMVASVTDSPRVGTRISVAIGLSVPCFYSPSASSSSDCSCARCFDIKPVAGDAEAGRPV